MSLGPHSPFENWHEEELKGAFVIFPKDKYDLLQSYSSVEVVAQSAKEIAKLENQRVYILMVVGYEDPT